MKVKICRLSKNPIAWSEYQREFAEQYDKVELLHVLPDSVPDALGKRPVNWLTMSKDLEQVEAMLREKYPNVAEENLPRSRKDWDALVVKYDFPVMVAKSSSNPKELVLVIIDMPIG